MTKILANSVDRRILINNKINQKENDNDTNCKKNKKHIAKKLAIASGVTLAAVYGVKKYQVKNIKNITKTFQEVFMRDDITPEQAREMLKRYKEIEKIKDRKDYAKALFAEAKKNFGLEDSPIKLIFHEQKDSRGFCTRDNSFISITSRCSRNRMMNTMHHEFRHALQNKMAYNMFPERAENLVLHRSNSLLSLLMGIVEPNKLKNNFGELSPQNVPEKYHDFASKCMDNMENYSKCPKNKHINYWKNFIEQDARKAGHTIDKFVKGKAFTFRKTREYVVGLKCKFLDFIDMYDFRNKKVI